MPAADGVRRYATGTTVPVERSRQELERLLENHDATAIGVHRDGSGTVIVFRMAERLIKHMVRCPHEQTEQYAEREFRRRWRSLLLIIKAKLELVASGDSSVEEAFLGQIMLAGGETLYESVHEPLARHYETREPAQLLLGAGK